jgi:uncharacterized membrane protein
MTVRVDEPTMSGSTSFDEVAKWGAIMLGMILAVPLVAILANQAPAALVAAIVVGFLGWAGVRSGVLASEADDEAEEADPLATLQERYAAGDISEAEFERRLERLLESDQRAGTDEGLDATAVERERASERE